MTMFTVHATNRAILPVVWRTPKQIAAVWRRRGLRAFDADKDRPEAIMGDMREEGWPGMERA
jgi:hypothetical protein